MNRQLLKNIRSLRTQKGLNQKELGQRIGMTQASFARFEAGARKTDFESLVRIAEVLGVDVCTLIHFHENGLKGAAGRSMSVESELVELKERESYLQRLNEQLQEQIEDKEEVIGLLRSKRRRRGG